VGLQPHEPPSAHLSKNKVRGKAALHPPRAPHPSPRACFKNGFVKGHDFSRAEKSRRIEGF
jgi:hypothetical protein